MCYNVQQLQRQQFKYGKKVIGLSNQQLQHDLKNYYSVSGFAHPYLCVINNQLPNSISFMRWGLIPFWVKSIKQAIEISSQTLNAKAETLFEKPAFRCAPYRRCLIPVNGFFEWYTKGKNKYPFFIYPVKEEYFMLGGIFDEWTNTETGEFLQTFSIVTTAANNILSKIHNSKKRMPLILDEEAQINWLNSNVTKHDLKNLMKPYPDEFIGFYSISKRITSRVDNPNVAAVTEKFIYKEIASDLDEM